jgi:hypothetical protein
MAKAPIKTITRPAKPAAKPAVKAAPKPSVKFPVASSAKTAAVKKLATAQVATAKAKVKKPKETSSTISQLASDILTDRIMPTLEQIKSIAASALGQDQTKGKKPKTKKKK